MRGEDDFVGSVGCIIDVSDHHASHIELLTLTDLGRPPVLHLKHTHDHQPTDGQRKTSAKSSERVRHDPRLRLLAPMYDVTMYCASRGGETFEGAAAVRGQLI